MPAAITLDDLPFTNSAHLLVEAGLAGLAVGERLLVSGRDPDLSVHLATWCRAQGHGFVAEPDGGERVGWVVQGGAAAARWQDAGRAGDARGVPAAQALPQWGLAARGALVEAGAPEFRFNLTERENLWSDDAARLYALAAAAQWDPSRVLDAGVAELSPVVDAALAQLLTFLIENENAALLVTARFLAQVHPHFREVVQVLAIQAADEARHVEVFTRRLHACRSGVARSTVLGQQSLQTLVEEPDFMLASFLLAVMGEGTFLTLLAFIERHAPDAATRTIMRLVIQDESRHVAFGISHLARQLAHDPAQRSRLTSAVRRRSEHLRQGSGMNQVVLDALVLLVAGELSPSAIARGHEQLHHLRINMDTGRRARLGQLGFSTEEAASLSALHTPNFM